MRIKNIKGAMLLLLVLSAHQLPAQQAHPYRMPRVKGMAIGDTSRPELLPEKRFWRAGGELMLAQVIPWSVNYFIRDADFAHISWQSIGHNLRLSSWEWDDNKFATNQFAHPYQGSMYFSAFRSNGYTFWQSAPAAFAGSLMWEIAGETHNPAPNDFINTSFGGISLGEMTYRLSNMIIDESARGFKRQMQEVFAFVLNPMNGFNRLLDGKWGKVNRNGLAKQYRPHLLRGDIEIGLRRISQRTEDILSKGRNEFFARLQLAYGDPVSNYKRPFENFRLTAEIGSDDSSAINIVHVVGNLYGWRIRRDHAGEHTASLSLNYDFYNNAAFFYGAQNMSFNLYSRYQLSKKTQLDTRFAPGLVLLGAIPDDYLYYGEGRDYDFGMGLNFVGDMKLSTGRFLLGLDYRGSWTKTVDGNPSSFALNAITADAQYRLWKTMSLGLQFGRLSLAGTYKDHPDVFHQYPFLRAAMGYVFGSR